MLMLVFSTVMPRVWPKLNMAGHHVWQCLKPYVHSGGLPGSTSSTSEMLVELIEFDGGRHAYVWTNGQSKAQI